MFILSLLENLLAKKVVNYTAAGFGDTLNGSIIDTKGYRSAMIVAALGDVANTAVITLKAFTGDQAALGDGAYKANTATKTATATNADNKLLVLEQLDIKERYLRADLVRGTANIVVENVIVYLFNPVQIPVDQSTGDVVDSDMNIA